MNTQQNPRRHKRRQQEKRPKYYTCEKCGKRIIQRKENGLWYFAYGRQRDELGNFVDESPVEIYVYGSIKMKCLRKECGYWNVLNFMPLNLFEDPSEKKQAAN